MRLIMRALTLLLIVGLGAAVWWKGLPPQLRRPNHQVPVLERDPHVKTEKATFGAGCFWGVEANFREVKGVVATAVGYEGGTTKNPTYQDVCTDATGHAEVVQVEYDPEKVSYDKLLQVFWTNHDPTTENRQGPDVGTQYRSVIFYESPEQKTEAEASKARLEKSGTFHRPVVTHIEPAMTFYKAEDYHQQYLEKNPNGYCGIGGTGVVCPIGVGVEA